MTESVHGIVINLNAYGAAIRLEGGELASAPAGDVDSHRIIYERALERRTSLAFVRHPGARRPMVMLIPQIAEEQLDEQIAEYLRSTQDWDAPDGVPSAVHHFLQKKRRAEMFE